MSSEQPLVVYPDTVTKQAPSPNPNESFGGVFIVLAVIVVLSATACFLSRLCSRRHQKHQHHPPKAHNSRPKEKPNNGPGGRERDIEFGFGKGSNPAAKQGGNNIGGVHGGNGSNGMKFAGEWEGKAGPYRPV